LELGKAHFWRVSELFELDQFFLGVFHYQMLEFFVRKNRHGMFFAKNYIQGFSYWNIYRSCQEN